MGTTYYLADPRYMTPAEIARAEAFEYGASICHKSVRLEGNKKKWFVYSVEIPTIILYNLPIDVRLVNNNGADEDTIGALIDSMNREGSRIEMFDECLKREAQTQERWFLSRPNTPEWTEFLATTLFERAPNALQYLKTR